MPNTSLAARAIHHRESFVFHGHDPDPWLSLKSMYHGQAHYEIDGGRFAVDDGAYLILNQGQAYTIDKLSPTLVESLCVFFPPELAADALHAAAEPDDRLLDRSGPAQPIHFFEKRHPHGDAVSGHLWQMRLALKRGPVSEGWIEEKLHELLAAMLQTQRDVRREMERWPAVRSATRQELYRRLHRARDFVHAGLAEPLTLADMAAVAALSPHHFLRSFKRAFGQTPHAYLTRQRLERARALLVDSEEPVTAICFRVGFASLGSFSALFRRHFGLSPRALRERAA